MSILKYKYKAHKFINYAFYVVVFIVGFLLGFSSNKLDFNKLISQVLMIDNVKAIENNFSVVSSTNYNVDTEYIYNKLFNETGYSIEDYPYILVMYSYYVSSDSYGGLEIYASNSIDNYVITGTNSSNKNLTLNVSTLTSNNNTIRYYERVDKSSGEIDRISGPYIDTTTGSTFISYRGNGSTSNGSNKGYTNFDLNGVSINSTINKLDFSEYMKTNYWLNDGSIFKDENHQDFKEVCWENFDELMFSVTIDSNYDGSSNVYYEGQQDGETYVENGFYVFDDIINLRRGTRIKSLAAFDYEHYASTWLSGATFNHLKNITSNFYLMDTSEKIMARYSDPINALGNYDIERGDSYYYDNLDKLKNSHYVDFTYYYNTLDDFKYDIFYLTDKKEKFCIYIPNQFVVTTLQINELGGFVGDIPIHNDKDDSFIDVSEISKNSHFSNFFSIINQFISSIRDTVHLITSYIYSFFLSLPPLVQMFIYSIITLIVVKTIIWMVVK